MNTDPRPSEHASPCDAAADWFVRLHSGTVSKADLRLFEQWRQADPEHDRQYRNVCRISGAAQHLSAQALRAILKQDAHPATPQQHRRLSRRAFGLGLVGACSSVLVMGVLHRQGLFDEPLETYHLQTRRGEHQELALPDGSILRANTDTLAIARLYEGRRTVELRRGEVFFSVARSTRSPFIIDAGSTEITVTGTRFNVSRTDSAVQVAVESGSVEVSGGRWWNRRTRRLAAGQAVTAYHDAAPEGIRTVDVTNIAAWQRGDIIFDDTPLALALEELNRYLPHPVHLDDTALRSHRISGIVRSGKPEAMLEMLPDFAPVSVHRQADGQIRILPR
ncbi:FecR family protein [Thauera linaloolentis]|uniref:Transmembrane sensor n=1 Tax=Thauera linaloolentis (strain DSM 12138 / JCM 21573 / CCUG 41526 / CIP 105981 / IAM 15112 / NBRC 102519 / 47Lol) TaxID=1123367 RepID=N6Y0P5_THAL4|nr:FecR family protein [Thauera linaloolentis]ENO87721.1 transmembrane sensor [Thauera linaloolentis 47Lol = DSM 12138]MCM8567587.1 FecR family protein [Thauera linaloolentis]